MFARSGLPREKFVVVSGIGCSSRLPYYCKTYGIHTLHGRAAPVAQGIKKVRPDLCVWMVTGDGDGFSIGTNHMIHLLRRNMDIKILLLNNQVYGLTKGQASPTSPVGTTSAMTPSGTLDAPVDVARLALAAGASFVARAHDRDGAFLEDVLMAAQNHRGTALVEVLTNCVSFNDGAFDDLTAINVQAEVNVKLRAGRPAIFGANEDKALAWNEGHLTVVSAGSPKILTHDPSNPFLAEKLVGIPFGTKPYPFGVLWQHSIQGDKA